MTAADSFDLQPSWTVETSISEPVESSALDLGYEVAFPFLAALAPEFDTH